MHSFFLPSAKFTGGKIIIKDPGQAHHIKRVLRLKEGNEIIIFNREGEKGLCVIASLDDEVALEIKSRLERKGKSKAGITVACAIPKKAKFDDIVDKLTQLGASRIIPLLTERVIVKLQGDKADCKRERWQKIACFSSEQSQRNSVPQVDLPKRLTEVLKISGEFDLKLIPTLEGKRKSLPEALGENRFRNILILIGPEGDFTPAEVRQAIGCGFTPVSLGNEVLRVDTAAIAVTGFIKLYENS